MIISDEENIPEQTSSDGRSDKYSLGYRCATLHPSVRSHLGLQNPKPTLQCHKTRALGWTNIGVPFQPPIGIAREGDMSMRTPGARHKNNGSYCTQSLLSI